VLINLLYPCKHCEICSLQAIEETKSHVEKKQALTYEEIEAEREEVFSLIFGSTSLISFVTHWLDSIEVNGSIFAT
jgi:hypothetical protein